MSERNLTDRVSALIDEYAEALSPQGRAELHRIRERIDQPVRIAVAGRVNSGKSTLVNALLRQAVAPTDVSECTRVVTWFQHGQPQRVEIRLHEGESIDVQLERDGTLPRTLPVDVERVASVHVHLDNEALRSMTVIDTPGLASINEDVSASSEQLLAMERGSLEAAGSADAIAYVINQTVKEDDLRMLTVWAEAGGTVGSSDGHGLTSSAVNAIGVLTKADKVGDGKDPWPVAVELATRQAERIREKVSTVIPVIGLLAATANTSALTERDAAHLAGLAELRKASPGLFRSAQRFVNDESQVSPEVRQGLLDRLDMFGLHYALDQIDAGVTGAIALKQALSRSSGIEQLEGALADQFLEHRSDALLAHSALDALETLTYSSGEVGDPAVVARLRNEIQKLRLDPAMHELAELDALHVSLMGGVRLSPELAEDLHRMCSARPLGDRLGVDPDEFGAMRSAAVAGVKRWRAFSFTEADPRRRRIADVMIRSYTLAAKQNAAR